MRFPKLEESLADLVAPGLLQYDRLAKTEGVVDIVAVFELGLPNVLDFISKRRSYLRQSVPIHTDFPFWYPRTINLPE